ncbi:MAG: hypothetical protein QOF95_1970, partial [Pseudonocardiales bacterium]|nr:hypothetical protein [Pseudonocardiales bacterium]
MSSRNRVTRCQHALMLRPDYPMATERLGSAQPVGPPRSSQGLSQVGQQ